MFFSVSNPVRRFVNREGSNFSFFVLRHKQGNRVVPNRFRIVFDPLTTYHLSLTRATVITDLMLPFTFNHRFHNKLRRHFNPLRRCFLTRNTNTSIIPTKLGSNRKRLTSVVSTVRRIRYTRNVTRRLQVLLNVRRSSRTILMVSSHRNVINRSRTITNARPTECPLKGIRPLFGRSRQILTKYFDQCRTFRSRLHMFVNTIHRLLVGMHRKFHQVFRLLSRHHLRLRFTRHVNVYSLTNRFAKNVQRLNAFLHEQQTNRPAVAKEYKRRHIFVQRNRSPPFPSRVLHATPRRYQATYPPHASK